MASLRARHSKGCALGAGRETLPNAPGCTCVPSYVFVVDDDSVAPEGVVSPARRSVRARLAESVLELYAALGRRVGRLWFERGLETGGKTITIDHFHPERVWYTPSNWSYLRRGLRGFEVRPTDVFVDFGCGKGRVLYQAARHPFGRVVGVEITPELGDEARKNLARNSHRFACRETEVVTMDVVDFPVPDDMTVAFFYDPFVGDTFRRVIDNIVESLDRNPRPLRIIYAVPVMAEYVLGTGRFALVRSVPIMHEHVVQRLAIFETSSAT